MPILLRIIDEFNEPPFLYAYKYFWKNIKFIRNLKQSLSKQVSNQDLENGRIYPPMKSIREVSIKIACDISEWFYRNGKATTYPVPRNLEDYIRKQTYDTNYTSYVPNTWKWPDEHMKPRSYDQVETRLKSDISF